MEYKTWFCTRMSILPSILIWQNLCCGILGIIKISPEYRTLPNMDFCHTKFHQTEFYIARNSIQWKFHNSSILIQKELEKNWAEFHLMQFLNTLFFNMIFFGYNVLPYVSTDCCPPINGKRCLKLQNKILTNSYLNLNYQLCST